MDVSGSRGAPAAVSAPSALRRPPEATLPLSAGILSTPSRIACLTWAVVRLGSAASTRAATPATCGVAIEVPLRKAQWLSPVLTRLPAGGVIDAGQVLATLTPGAARSTVCTPKFENETSPSVLVLAATQMMFGRS